MEENLTQLGRNIARLRIKKGITQEKLGELTNYSTNHISKLESARTNPSFDLIVKIANALQVDLQILFENKKEKEINCIKREFTDFLNTANKEKIYLLYEFYKIIEENY